VKALGVMLLAALVALPPFMGEYHVYLLSLTLLWGIFALSMGLVLGYLGEINFGQAAFVALAAYTSSLLRMKLGFGFWTGAPIALAAVVAMAALVGLITLRLRGPFFALVTLGFGEIVRLVITNWQDLTNGPLGLRPIALPEPLLGLHFDTKLRFYYLVLVTLAASFAILARLIRSRPGQMMIARRRDPRRLCRHSCTAAQGDRPVLQRPDRRRRRPADRAISDRAVPPAV
jgi:branched-chain amino acid transport system permease protein